MFKLLIVDDEPLVREGLSLSIDWEEYGYSPVGTASDGKEALEKVAALSPDVVITDMKMNVMDGVSLIRELKQSYPKIRIVVLTAYNEFSYARAAIEGNVFTYLTKPAGNEEIIDVFCRLRDEMVEEMEIQSRIIGYNRHRIDKLLSHMMLAPDVEEEDLKELREYFPEQRSRGRYLVALAELDRKEPRGSLPEIRKQFSLMDSKIDRCISESGIIVYKSELAPDTIALLVSGTPQDSRTASFLESICGEYSEDSGETASIGVSNPLGSLRLLPKAYRDAKFALEKKAQLGLGRVIRYNDVQDLLVEMPLLSREEKNRWISDLDALKEDELLERIEGYFSKLTSCSMDLSALKDSLKDLVRSAETDIFGNPDTMRFVLCIKEDPASVLQSFQTAEEIRAFLVLLVRRGTAFCRSTGEFRKQENGSYITKRAADYIIRKYHEDIRVSDIARDLHISESRLMHVFKEETGKSVQQFLAMFRVNLAEVLLKTGHYKLYEIAEMVGYSNPLSFRRAFLKIKGVNPSRYVFEYTEREPNEET